MTLALLNAAVSSRPRRHRRPAQCCRIEQHRGDAMPHVYKDKRRIRALRGKVRGGITVVIESPHEVDGLRTLLRLAARLPREPLANAYQAIDSAGPGLASWPEWRQSGAQNATESEHAKSKEPESEIDAALGFASSLWNAQSEDKEQLALAMTLPKPGR